MQKETRENSLGAAEREAFKKLETEVEEPMKLGMMAYNAIIGSLALLGDIPLRELWPSRRVTTSLLLRLANDLRCCALLAARGYPARACRPAAGGSRSHGDPRRHRKRRQGSRSDRLNTTIRPSPGQTLATDQERYGENGGGGGRYAAGATRDGQTSV